MEIIKNLFFRLRHTALLLLVGFILIIYIALGFLYFQQGTAQSKLNQQITKLGLVVTRPLPSIDKLRAEYDAVSQALTPMTDSAAIKMLVDIARANGIDITDENRKFVVPSASFSQTKMGGGTYQLISFRRIKVQGDYDKVLAFITDLDSGKTLQTMVLRQVNLSWVTVTAVGEEGARRAEFRDVADAVLAMMLDNGLTKIPEPLTYARGIATNIMGDNLTTEGIMEGFPDIKSTATDKGYTGEAVPQGGYLLYQHDKISTDNTTLFQTVDYFPSLTTRYYYTAEADGTVRQFNGPAAITAGEYPDRQPTMLETLAYVDVDIYMLSPKPQEKKS